MAGREKEIKGGEAFGLRGELTRETEKNRI